MEVYTSDTKGDAAERGADGISPDAPALAEEDVDEEALEGRFVKAEGRAAPVIGQSGLQTPRPQSVEYVLFFATIPALRQSGLYRQGRGPFFTGEGNTLVVPSIFNHTDWLPRFKEFREVKCTIPQGEAHFLRAFRLNAGMLSGLGNCRAGDRYSGAEVKELETTETGRTLWLRPINPRNGGALGPAVSVNSTKLVVHGFPGALEVGDQGVVACLRVGDVPFFFPTPQKGLRAMPHGAFTEPVLVSKFRVVNFVDSPVSTIIAELLHSTSSPEEEPTVTETELGPEFSTSVFTANFPRSYPALGVWLSLVVQTEPDCLLERKTDNSRHVSLSCDGFMKAEPDFMARFTLPKHAQRPRRSLPVSGTIVVLSAVLAIVGLLVRHKAEKSGKVELAAHIGSRLATALGERGVESDPLLGIATALDPRAVMEAARIVRGTHPAVAYRIRLDKIKWRRKKLRDGAKGIVITSAGMVGILYGVLRVIGSMVSRLLRRVQDFMGTSRVTRRLLKTVGATAQPEQAEKVHVLFLLE